MSGVPEHVASGGFRVDRSRALEKLAEYQMPDPKRFLLPWLRCAQACGATSAAVTTTWMSLELTFDGTPLAGRFIREPFDALFTDEADSLRHRDLATGLLTVFRLSPAEVSIVSGTGLERLRLLGSTAENAAAETHIDGVPRTVLTVKWKGKGLTSGLTSECSEAAAAAGRMLPFPLTFNGAVAGREPQEPFVLSTIDGTRVRVCVPEDPGARDTVVRVHKRGVLANEVPIQSRIDVAAEIDRDDFVLDASQTTAVRDERLVAALGAVPAAIDELIATACAVQRKYPGLAAFLFAPDAEPLRRKLSRGTWTSRLSALATDWTGIRGGGSLKGCMEFEARVTRWLRIVAARNLTAYVGDSGQPVAKALWETPLYLGLDGKGLSLFALKEQHDRHGLVPVAREVRAAPEGLDVVWLPEGPDGTLESLFPGRVKEMDELLEALSKAPPPQR